MDGHRGHESAEEGSTLPYIVSCLNSGKLQFSNAERRRASG